MYLCISTSLFNSVKNNKFHGKLFFIKFLERKCSRVNLFKRRLFYNEISFLFQYFFVIICHYNIVDRRILLGVGTE